MKWTRYWREIALAAAIVSIGVLLAIVRIQGIDSKIKDQNLAAKDSTVTALNKKAGQLEAERAVSVLTESQLRKDSSRLYDELQVEKKAHVKVEYIASMQAKVIDSFKAATGITIVQVSDSQYQGNINWVVADSGKRWSTKVEGSTKLSVTAPTTGAGKLRIAADSTIGTFAIETDIISTLQYNNGILKQTARATNPHITIGNIEANALDPKLFTGTTPTVSWFKRNEYGIIVTAIAAGEAFAIYELMKPK